MTGTVSNGNLAAAVLQTLRWRCGAATVEELARALEADELEIIDVLYDLERQGLVQPTIWRAVP